MILLDFFFVKIFTSWILTYSGPSGGIGIGVSDAPRINMILLNSTQLYTRGMSYAQFLMIDGCNDEESH